MAVKISESLDQLSQDDIVKIERQLGFALPIEYENFLLKHNGGYPKPDSFPIQGHPSSQRGLVHYFLNVKEGDVYDLVSYFKNYRDRVPPNFLPIACDPGGNLICISVCGEDIGKIYFWDHEQEVEEGKIPGYDNTYLIADSFGEFLGSLAKPD